VRPVRFLLQNPPSVALVVLLLAPVALALFFLPIHDFVHNLEVAGGFRRRKRRSARRSRGEG